MKDHINAIYKNHSQFYKILLFVVTTILIVFIFPKSGRFKYNFEKGKPWQTENLYAPFNFAIQKSNVEVLNENAIITSQTSRFFNKKADLAAEVSDSFEENFGKVFNDNSIVSTPLLTFLVCIATRLPW